ncbi:mechanosensitive ion channel family protein [Fulvivirga kasyanovii]|uniref:Mechanosensitive ion channel family protein n=1 Tax=Fulvivirga kasyanovii TaxID=396812 RepID=A0ABW9RQ26_9BACT|nr:mechanosensitive ion channel family protein [Fulvivirga kasyanovii]MTI26267.1 mechanosensitive ion channel family protein [Fulvivirga kasyanovii]
MKIQNIKIIETVVAIVVYLILRGVTNKIIDKTVATSFMRKTRAKIVKKGIDIIFLIILFTIVLIVWGVDQTELAFFIGSVLTVIGVALFAQWSILSNITFGIILFFNHFVKLDDSVKIMDKEYDIEGRVSDIGLFFVILKTKEDEKVSIPNNVFMQKMIKQQKSE